MAVALHCSADGSGVTDWISNVTRIAPASGEDPRPWLTPIASGNDRLLTFVHEATHNWCFNSAVVHAQMYVAGRAELNATAYLMLQDDPAEDAEASPTHLLQLIGAMLRAAIEDPRPRFGDRVAEVRDQLGYYIHDDVIRLEVVNELFRPLAEGLALFAEYDAVSRLRSRAWSPLPTAIAWNFAGLKRFQDQPLLEPTITITQIAGEKLHDARLSEWAITTKATVLRAPFRSEGGGYLPGYLTVKSMWGYLFRQDARLYGESDLVLTYLRSYFFEDVDLAAELLAPPVNNCIYSTNRLLGHFNRRMSDLFEVTGEDVRTFEVTLDSDVPLDSRGLGRTVEEHHEARRLFAERVNAMAGSTAAEVSGFAHNLAMSSVNSLMALRKFVTIMSVEVDVDDRGVVTWQGHEILTVAGDDLVHPAAGPHKMDILLGMSGEQTLNRLAVLSRERDVHSVTVILGLPAQKQALRESLLTEFASREQRESAAENLQFTADAIVAEDWGLRMNRDHVREQLRSVVDRMYHDVALRYSSGYEAMDRCGELMAENGLRPLLGSVETVRQVAFLGLAASLNSHREEVEKKFQARGMDLAALLTTLNERWAEHGFPPQVHEQDTDDKKQRLLIPFL